MNKIKIFFIKSKQFKKVYQNQIISFILNKEFLISMY